MRIREYEVLALMPLPAWHLHQLSLSLQQVCCLSSPPQQPVPRTHCPGASTFSSQSPGVLVLLLKAL